jgi:DNA primase
VSGRLAGFSGRAFGDHKPKYLNSPEGVTFDKGKLLYNAHAARGPAHDGASMLIVEGYFDVIACVGAGFAATVGSMGTALTSDHLRMAWRMSSVPVLCFDGDAAGRRAASKALTTALPLLHPGQSLSVALLPMGFDPDKLVRERGPDALRSRIEAARGIADTFWQLSTAGKALDTIAARAAVEQELVEAYKAVPDRQLRQKYLRDVRDRINAIGRRQPVIRSNGFSNHSTSPGSIRLVHGVDHGGSLTLREATMLREIVRDPASAAEAAERIAGVKGVSEHARQVLGELLYLIGEIPEAEASQLMQAIAGSAISADIDEALAVCSQAGIRN